MLVLGHRNARDIFHGNSGDGGSHDDCHGMWLHEQEVRKPISVCTEKDGCSFEQLKLTGEVHPFKHGVCHASVGTTICW